MANMAVNALRLTDTLQREQQGHSSLFSILSLAKQQQPLAGRKTILFFSEGLQAPPTLDHVLLAAISEANRANVSVYAVDARGLSTVSDTAAARATLDEAVATSTRQQMLRGFRLFTREEMLISDTAESALRMDTIGTLEQLAESTGGLLISHTNDVRAGIARAVGDLRGYYEVAYSPANLEFDGRFRRIALKVTRPGVTVQTRSGYFAMPPGEGTATFSYEVQLLKALRSPDPPHDLPVRTRAFRFGPEAGGQRYTVVLEVPLDGIQFEKDPDPAFERAHFSFLGVLRTPWGAVAEKFSQDAPVWLPRKRHDDLKQGNAVFMRSFTLPEGRYRLETAVMDRQSGRTSVDQSRLSVPPGRSTFGLSSLAVVKRTERVPKGALASDDPFRVGEARIVPWVTEAAVGPDQGVDLFFVAYVAAGLAEAATGHARVPPRHPVGGPGAAGPAAARRPGPDPVRGEPPRRTLRAGAITRSRAELSRRSESRLGAHLLPGERQTPVPRPLRRRRLDPAPPQAITCGRMKSLAFPASRTRPPRRRPPGRPGPPTGAPAHVRDAGRARDRRRRGRGQEGPGRPRPHPRRLRRLRERRRADAHQLRVGRGARGPEPRRRAAAAHGRLHERRPRQPSRPQLRGRVRRHPPLADPGTAGAGRRGRLPPDRRGRRGRGDPRGERRRRLVDRPHAGGAGLPHGHPEAARRPLHPRPLARPHHRVRGDAHRGVPGRGDGLAGEAALRQLRRGGVGEGLARRAPRGRGHLRPPA